MKPVLLRPAAHDDLEQLVREHVATGGPGFGVDALRMAVDALSSIEAAPDAGARLLGRLCEIPGLQTRRTRHLPLLWLYFEADDRVDVVRLLSERQDVPRLMHWAR